MTAPGRVKEVQARLTTLERQLAELVQHVDGAKRTITDETRALRQQMDRICLSCVAELAQHALREAERTASDGDRRDLHAIRQRVQEPEQGSRMAAYDSLSRIHKDCSDCKPKEPCAMGRAGIIIRDLLVMTVMTGRGPWNNELLVEALQEALMSGCNRDRLNAAEKSQLTLAFNKVISLGKTREGFDETVRSNSMYGPLLRTDEAVDKLFQAYSSCSSSSPHHISKNKASGKNRTRGHRAMATAPESSADEKDPQPQDMSMLFPTPFLTQGGDMQFAESHWLVSEDHNTCHAEVSSGPHPVDLPAPFMRCVECGFEDPMPRSGRSVHHPAYLHLCSTSRWRCSKQHQHQPVVL